MPLSRPMACGHMFVSLGNPAAFNRSLFYPQKGPSPYIPNSITGRRSFQAPRAELGLWGINVPAERLSPRVTIEITGRSLFPGSASKKATAWGSCPGRKTGCAILHGASLLNLRGRRFSFCGALDAGVSITARLCLRGRDLMFWRSLLPGKVFRPGGILPLGGNRLPGGSFLP